MNESINERERALALLESQMNEISMLFKVCHLKKGRGALVLYSHQVKEDHKVNEINYNSQEDAIDLFDDHKSKNDLKDMVTNYDPKKEGILILITDSMATWFITCKLK